MADNRILNKPSGAGFLSDLGKTVKGAAGAVVNEVKKDAGKVINEVKKEVREEVRDVKAVVSGVDQFVKTVKKGGFDITPSGSQVLNAGRDILEKLFPQKISDPEGQQYVKDTQDFRAQVSTAKNLQGQLAGMSPADPRYAGLKQKLEAANARLQSSYGYTADTAPKPGALWVDPDLMERTVANGAKLNAKSFPTRTPVTQPPSAMDVVFQGGRSFTLTDAAGNKTVVRTPEEYKAAVAKNRAEVGMPRQDGEPIAVHVSFEGGGGKGKRYGPAIAEMYRNGVVPASISGTSAGAIAAGLAAAGADPGQIDALMKSGELSKLYDINLGEDGGGVMDGKAAYDLFDRELRKLTGITDRPVTFADLKMPLQIVAAKMSDSQPPAGQEDMTQMKNRVFVFSQETTPNTPVALAMRASMSIPGAFDPVKMVDPASGRQVTLVDGGVFDNLPMHYNKNDLPNIGVTLMDRGDNLASSHTSQPKPLPGGNLDSTHILWNALNGYTLLQNAAGGTDDYNDRTKPKHGDFMLGLPTWDLTNPDKGDSTMGFGYDPKVDPKLDVQTRGVVQSFLKQFIGDFGKPGASGTNTPNKLPEKLAFSTDVQAGGKTWKANYNGGNVVTFTSGNQKYDVHVGEKKLQAMWLDHMAFGDLNGQLGKSLNDYLKAVTRPGIRFGI
jgi:NTE family protein